jgi:hypothetical protein
LAHSRQDQPGEWAFGAGVQAITFVSRFDTDHYLEHGESWFTRLGRYSITPGHRQAVGVKYRVFDPSAAILRCFSCHSTGGVALSGDGAIVPAEPGIRCEDCHGPSAAHARDPQKIKPLNPAHLTASEINSLCGACHRMPLGAAALVKLTDPWNARHQPLMLSASKCFSASAGRLSCLTCHAPHSPVERNLARYNQACAACHASPRHTHPVAGRACASCHMPAVHPADGLTFANHRIAVYRDGDPLTPQRASSRF